MRLQKRKMLYILSTVLCVAVGATATSDLQAAGTRSLPPGLVLAAQPLEAAARVEMAAVDVDSLLAEDAARQSDPRPSPLRIASPLAVALDPSTSGSWHELADGWSLWRLEISSPGALHLSLGLDHFDLPPGAALWVHDGGGGSLRGPYTRRNRNSEGGLWTAAVLGDTLLVELLAPPSGGDRTELEISSVNHGYRPLVVTAEDPETKQGSCNIDVICAEGDSWRRQIRSAALIVVAGVFRCSGHLVNNTTENDEPYFLTANHCLDSSSDAASAVVYWNFESPTCGLLGGGSLADNQSGSTLLATWQFQTGSDFTLVLLDEQPQPSFGVYYAGWDATGNVPGGSVAIHQPGGDEKAISFNDDPLTKSDHYGNGSHQWRVDDWEEGTTEPGSSGSCIFEPDSGLCVGTLSAGSASCANPNGFDVYGRVDVHWEGAGSPQNRLKDWLDPLGTGQLVLGGKEPGAGGIGETWLIPAAASTPGVGTSNWKSQIVVVNPTTDAMTVDIHYVPQFVAWPGAHLDGPYTIAPMGTVYIDDPLLDLNPTAGLLYVTVSGNGSVVSSRTYNVTPAGSTFGQGIPGILVDEAEFSSMLVLPLVHSVPGRYRTNLGIVQTSATFFAVQVTVYAPDGRQLGQKTYASTVAWTQINNLFNGMGISESIEGGWIEVRLLTGAPAYWMSYASVVDADTNDPTYVLPVPK